MVPPFQIGVRPEIIDELFGILEGTGRLPSVDKPRKHCALKG